MDDQTILDELAVLEEEKAPGLDTPAPQPKREPWWKAPSVEKPLESYQGHPLNFTGKKGLGRLIRGMEGLFGSLAYAFVDVVLGSVEMLWDLLKQKPPAPPAV